MKRLIAFLFLALSPVFSAAATQPVILFANFSCTDAQPHIGSTIRFYSAMVEPQFQLGLTATSSAAGPSGFVALDSSSFATLPSQTLYITDGQRAWEVFFTTGNPVILQNSNLIGGGATPLAVADYDSLVLRSFTAYGGTKVTGFPAVAATQMWVNLGAVFSDAMRDDGFGADLGGAGDGLWQGHFQVTNLDRIFENVQIYANGRSQNVDAAQRAGEIGVNIDAQLPKIEQYAFTTSKVNYNGILYLSALSQGNSTPQATNALGTFSVIANKSGTNITVTIDTPGTDKVLSPIFIPNGGQNLGGAQNWIGDDGSGNFLPDDVYSVSLGISDIHGVQGVTLTSLVRITSLRIRIENIVLTPSGLPTDPAFTDGLITNVSYRVVVDRENGGDLAPSLRLLNWTLAGISNDLNEFIAGSPVRLVRRLNTVFNLSELDFLRSNGTVGIEGNNRDVFSGSDTDTDFLWMFRGAADSGLMPNCYTPDNIGTTTTASALVWMPDGNKTNDWDSVRPFNRIGSALAPTRLESNLNLIFRGATPPEGNYRLRLRAFITGLDALRVGDPADAADTRDYCAPATNPPVFRSEKIHFAPSARPEGATSGQGFGIYAEDTSATFVVSRVLPPTGDTSPPFVLDSTPAEDAEVRGADFGVLAPLSVVLRDNESPISSDSSVTRIILKDPDGNHVLGSSRTDGGNPNNQMTVYFYPLQALSASGIYTMEVSACSAICMPTTQIQFTVLDERTPSVLAIEVLTLSEGIKSLALSNGSFQGPFSYVSEVAVRLGMGSGTSNEVDWQSSTLTLFELTSGTPVQYADFERVSPLTSTAQAPGDSRLRYRLVEPVNRAGQFEIRIKAVSKNAGGTTFVGPGSSFIQPRIATQLNTNALGVNHQGTLLNALVAPFPVTITTNSVSVTPSSATISVVAPIYGPLGAVSGFLPLVGVPGAGWQMMVAGMGLVTNRIRFLYNASLPPRIILYYDDSQIPLGVNETSLAIYAYDGSWQQVTSGIVASQAGAFGNTFTITPPNGTDTSYVYGIFYPDSTGVVGAPTPTPVSFKNTRSFNPSHANSLYRRARIFYSNTLPRTVEARVYDTAGVLVRNLELGSEINLADVQSDPIYGGSNYFFEWDGRNDSGSLVRNGIYLVRWKVVRVDGTAETAVKPVALIK